MLFKSQVVTQASGSIGGTTFSHNGSGMYMRARAIPTNPNTPQQAAVRALVSSLSVQWGLLTAAQRAAWDLYAANVTVTNRLGDQINLSGFNHYIRSNVPRLQADPTNLPRVDDAPTVFDLGNYTAPTIAASATVSGYQVTFDNADDWANEDDAAMLVYGSRPMGASVNFFKGPFRFADAILGDATTAPTSPASVVNPFTLTQDQKVGVRFQVTRADGRLSSDLLLMATVGV